MPNVARCRHPGLCQAAAISYLSKLSLFKDNFAKVIYYLVLLFLAGILFNSGSNPATSHKCQAG
ncbi:MAG: hypothetical protein ACLQDI_24935, partial [Syntrophobacteraceae bacterium]